MVDFMLPLTREAQFRELIWIYHDHFRLGMGVGARQSLEFKVPK